MQKLSTLLFMVSLSVLSVFADSNYVQRYFCRETASALWGEVTISVWADAEIALGQFFNRILAKGVTLDENSPLFNFRLSNSGVGAYTINDNRRLKILYSGTLTVYFANGTWYDDQAIDFSCEFAV